MSKFEFAIFIKDTDGKRAKKGDIIGYKPYPWDWGIREMRDFLIIVIDGLTSDEAKELCIPHYEFPAGTIENPDDKGEILEKRRYKLDWTKLNILETIDEELLNDRDIVYQPLKTKTLTIDALGEDLIFDKKENKFQKKVKK